MNPEIESLHKLAAHNNDQAITFLNRWNAYCHRIDDFIDEKKQDPNELLALLIDANLLYSHPYYRNHAHVLLLIVAGITGRYQQSVEWEQCGQPWKQQWADTLRFAGNEMLEAVAMLEGGFELQQKVGSAARELAWQSHHQDGSPV
jgi:hypothetical protein